jgi:hypothetical protein
MYRLSGGDGAQLALVWPPSYRVEKKLQRSIFDPDKIVVFLHNPRWRRCPSARAGDRPCSILLGRIVMKTLITALAVTALLATSAVAKTPRNKEVRVQPNNSVSRKSVSRNPVAQINAAYCRFEHGETDPDPRIRLQLARDCREHENSESE